MKADIIKTLEKRAEHFDSIHHSYESREIWSAIDVIERLMPPELFSIPVVSKSVTAKDLKCPKCKKHALMKYIDGKECTSCGYVC